MCLRTFDADRKEMQGQGQGQGQVLAVVVVLVGLAGLVAVATWKPWTASGDRTVCVCVCVCMWRACGLPAAKMVGHSGHHDDSAFGPTLFGLNFGLLLQVAVGLSSLPRLGLQPRQALASTPMTSWNGMRRSRRGWVLCLHLA